VTSAYSVEIRRRSDHRHTCVVHGATIAEEALVGNGSTVLDGARIGVRAMVAAGALVTPGTDIPDGMLALGAPPRSRARSLEHPRALGASQSRRLPGTGHSVIARASRPSRLMSHAGHPERHFTGNQVVRDLVLGMADGLTVPFALAAGLTGAIAATWIIVVAGLAEIAAGAIAMGLGGYLAARSEAEHYESERAREHREVRDKPEAEMPR